VKRITRSEIESVAYDDSSDEIVGFGRNSTRIVHSATRTGEERFMEQMEFMTGTEIAVLGAMD
jgi:hypothetical protein